MCIVWRYYFTTSPTHPHIFTHSSTLSPLDFYPFSPSTLQYSTLLAQYAAHLPVSFTMFHVSKHDCTIDCLYPYYDLCAEQYTTLSYYLRTDQDTEHRDQHTNNTLIHCNGPHNVTHIMYHVTCNVSRVTVQS